MNAKEAAWFAAAFLLCIAAAGILRSCVFVRIAASEARLQRVLASFPEPENVVLMDEVAGVGSGSDEKCYTAYVQRLYGSDHTAEDVFGFFRDTLVSGGEWEEIEQHSAGGKLSFHDRQQGFRLSIDYNIGSYAMPGFATSAEHSLAKARQQSAMPFVVAVNHADRATSENCWPGWEPCRTLSPEKPAGKLPFCDVSTGGKCDRVRPVWMEHWVLDLL